MQLLLFILITYSLAFLVADAKIFGCDTTAYVEDPEDEEYIQSVGFLKIRPLFLRVRFFRELFSCYFCLGIWVGPVVHWLLHSLFGKFYFLPQRVDSWGVWFQGIFAASLLGAVGSMFMNAVMEGLENWSTYRYGEEDEDPLDGNSEDLK